jgi:hypothetical protein
MLPIRQISLALFLPEELNQAKALAFKRLRMNIRSRCRNKECLRPDHHVLEHGAFYTRWLKWPAERDPKKPRDEWLTYPEMNFLTAQMRIGSAAPSDFLVRFSNHIALPYLTVGAVWLQLQEQIVKSFEEYTL